MQRSAFILWSVLLASAVQAAFQVYEGWGSPFALRSGIGIALALLILGAVAVAVGLNQRSSAQITRSKASLEILNAQVREQSQAIDFFADGLDLAIFITDREGIVTYGNRTARELFEFPEPVGRSILAITLSYDLEKLVLRVAEAEEPLSAEIVFANPIQRNVLAKALFNPDGAQVFLSLLDVTSLRRLERVRQDFVANVSHELRTPMSIIRAYAETLMDNETMEEATLRDYLPKIIDEIDRLSGLTRDLLVLSTAELEKVQGEPCDFAAICESAVAQLSKKAVEKGLELTYAGPEECWIKANPSQMTQVMLNLIDNALNYTTKGRVAVTLVDHAENVVLTVRDTGIGIATEHIPRIFERFYRVDKGRSRSTGGTGLGLSIVKHIVEAHEGTVAVTSGLQQGSEFQILLPKNDHAEKP